MKSLKIKFLVLILGLIVIQCDAQVKLEKKQTNYPLVKSEQEWKSILTNKEYNILFKKDTEPAFTGEYNDLKMMVLFYVRPVKTLFFFQIINMIQGQDGPLFLTLITNQTLP